MLKEFINPLNGEIEYRYIKDDVKKLSKNAKRKAKRYAKKVKHSKVKTITSYQYSCIETHRARFGCNPYLKVANNWV